MVASPPDRPALVVASGVLLQATARMQVKASADQRAKCSKLSLLLPYHRVCAFLNYNNNEASLRIHGIQYPISA